MKNWFKIIDLSAFSLFSLKILDDLYLTNCPSIFYKTNYSLNVNLASFQVIRVLLNCYQLQMKSTKVLIVIRLKIWETFLDASKAFDKVWHTGLKSTLKSYDVDGSLLKLKENYLTGLPQRVVLNDQIPWWKNILAEVSQGSVVRSLLFLMCNNDLPNGIESIVK